MADKYGAVWVSHSSIGDFLKCPRLYYLHNVYKDPKTRRKITAVSGAMALGSAVHGTLEALKELPLEERLTRDLLADYEQHWQTLASGKKGGFTNTEDESAMKARGRAMIERVIANPGPIAKKTVRLKKHHNDVVPNFFLSEDEGLILCGAVDWLEYIPEDDSLRIIDFKTGKYEEEKNSLQLPIYLLLLKELQHRAVHGAAYWYLEKDDAPVEMALPDATEARERVLALARTIKDTRTAQAFACPRGEEGCYGCRPYEKILRGEAEYVGIAQYGQDGYLVT